MSGVLKSFLLLQITRRGGTMAPLSSIPSGKEADHSWIPPSWPVSPPTAVQECSELGGHLASIHDFNKDLLLPNRRKLFSETCWRDIIPPGLCSLQVSSVGYEWSDGTKFGYSHNATVTQLTCSGTTTQSTAWRMPRPSARRWVGLCSVE
uniref:C-type lectin domain-containing protein n=1 Tax=Oryzias melastigma TaxID=30732 RepID=A0A3B3BN45_ORYME